MAYWRLEEAIQRAHGAPFAGSRQDYRAKQVYRHELHDGDFVLIGETTLVFKRI